MRLRLALAVLALSATAFGAGQSVAAFRVGVIVSKEGTARVAGDAQSLAAIAYASRLRANGGVFGIPLKVEVEDDAGDPAQALKAAQTLVAQGVDALVCCTVPAVAVQVATWAEHTGVVVLSPSILQGVDAKPYWSFSLAPRDLDALAAVVADAQATGASSIALMTLDNSFGDAALADVRALAKDAGMSFAGDARYAPGATDLTPEGLWIATRQPDAVIVWGLKQDLPVALAGLRRRGYEGPVYGRTALLRAVAGNLDLSGLQGVRFAVAPITVAAGLGSSDDPCAGAARTAASRLQAVYSGVLDLPSAAPVYDALDLLKRAFEQVAALHLGGDALTQQRQAVRDSLVGLPPTCGAGGLYDLREGERDALRPKGLAIAEVEGGRLVAAP
jgi:branched-chain amino acid transport system substrate-binding protein